MLGAFSKAFFHLLAKSDRLKGLASRYGMASERSFARRFIAGESLDEAIAVARGIQERGWRITLDYLGESVSTLDAAEAATREYLSMLDVIGHAGVEPNISLKLTQLGLDVDRNACLAHLREIVTAASHRSGFVRIDMENSPYTAVTLSLFETLWHEGLRNVGVVLQSVLHRSEEDVERLIALGARVRLVKGAYKEPASVAWQHKADVDAAFLKLMKRLLVAGVFPALATHDPDMIAAARSFVAQRQIGYDRFEFQMLFGVRRDLQTSLASAGYGVRVYIPFGREWFPYFMRRLGERPANVGFVLRSLLRER
jgi:proline dehydrogenase